MPDGSTHSGNKLLLCNYVCYFFTKKRMSIQLSGISIDGATTLSIMTFSIMTLIK